MLEEAKYLIKVNFTVNLHSGKLGTTTSEATRVSYSCEHKARAARAKCQCEINLGNNFAPTSDSRVR